MKYAVSPEGVAELKKMSAAVIAGAEEIKSLVSGVQAVADEHSTTLGPHISSLNDVLDQVRSAEEAAVEPVEGVSHALNEVADKYEDVIGNDPFS